MRLLTRGQLNVTSMKAKFDLSDRAKSSAKDGANEKGEEEVMS